MVRCALARSRARQSSSALRSCAIGIRCCYDTARVIADPIVRNSATICGNVAHGDPGNDHPATMIALDASFVIRGATGTRTVAARDFFVGLFTTVLEPDEIVTEIVDAVAAGAVRWRVLQARAEGRRLRDGGGRRAGDGRRERFRASGPASP